MKTLKRKESIGLCLLLMMLAVFSLPAVAATPEEIEASIDAGIAWLVSQQNPDGSWEDCPSRTAFAVIKLEERAFELGFDSPFDQNYPHKAAVEAGLDFIFTKAYTTAISSQTAGNPDTDGDGTGVYFYGSRRTYDTGICIMAIAASREPNRVVNVPGSPVNGWTYKNVLIDSVDWMAFAQTDPAYGSYRGGWRYNGNDSSSDNSVTGYAVLGLAYAETPLYGFNCTVPQFVKDELSIYIDSIQCDSGDDDGGSGYADKCSWVNILKTGNFIFEMTFVGDPCESPRLQRALAYLGRRWDEANMQPGWKGPPPHYQAMYCVMKGLTYAGIGDINVGGMPVDWYDEFADAVVSNQQPDGSWPDSPCYVNTNGSWGTRSGLVLATEWALLTLEAIAPPQPEPFGQWVYQCNSFELMNLDDYVTGTPPFTWTHDEPDHVTLDIDPNNVLTIDYDHSWYGEDVVLFTVTDATGMSASVYATFTVIGVPVVGDIPDQTTPFETFDLDDYLSGMAPEDVGWSASDPGGGWTVDIDANNVVTVTAPEGATEPVTITFTATNNVCPGWWLEIPGNEPPSDSDDATFVVNRPPVAICKDVTVECPEIVLPEDVDDGSYDPDDDPITLSLSPAGPYPLGTTAVVLTVTDDKGESDTCSATVTVVDTTPPVIICPEDEIIECPADPNLFASGSVFVDDNCCGGVTVTYSGSSAGTCPTVITRTWTATDESGNSSSCTQVITVQDTTPPEVSCSATVLKYCSRCRKLWKEKNWWCWWRKPHHYKLIRIEFDASDICGSADVSGMIDIGCRQIPVVNGQVIKLSCVEDRCHVKKIGTCGRHGWHGILNIKAETASLIVTAVDECGNTATCTKDLCELIKEDPKQKPRK